MKKLNYDSLVENYLKACPLSVMANHGKSFYFASIIFSKDRLIKIATLYKLCRFIDDCADELEEEESKLAINKIISDLENPQHLTPFNTLVKEVEAWGVQRSFIKELVIGAHFDAQGGRIYEMNDLMLYCYRVAGVVGIMMCPLIGVRDKRAYPHAIDLGLGMQLTNICRDVLEDANNGRLYLPECKVTNYRELSSQGKTPQKLKELVEETLDIADTYYQSAYDGLAFIPLRPRIVILLAGELYRHIGVKIRKSNYEVLEGRIRLSLLEKIFLSIKTILKLGQSYFWLSEKHSKDLHSYISGVPGVNA